MPWNRCAALGIAVLALFSLACKEQTAFEDLVLMEEPIADFERVRLRGGEKLILEPVDVTSDMIHPEFIGRWSNLKQQVDVDFYIMREKDFNLEDLDADPSTYKNVFWTSAPGDGVPFGATRVSDTHVHPSVDRWVMFFYNPNPNSITNEAELSARIRLSYRQ